MKLTKTQLKLLEEAVASRSGRCYTTLVCGRGGGGGLVTKYKGHRQSDAACALRDRGLLVFLNHEFSHTTSNGYQTHFTLGIWEITEKGREVLKGVK